MYTEKHVENLEHGTSLNTNSADLFPCLGSDEPRKHMTDAEIKKYVHLSEFC